MSSAPTNTTKSAHVCTLTDIECIYAHSPLPLCASFPQSIISASTDSSSTVAKNSQTKSKKRRPDIKDLFRELRQADTTETDLLRQVCGESIGDVYILDDSVYDNITDSCSTAAHQQEKGKRRKDSDVKANENEGEYKPFQQQKKSLADLGK